MAGAAPLVGRREELDRARHALDQPGALVLVSGDAGIGKSRLVAEVVASWPGPVLAGGCLPLTRTLPLLPITEMLDERRRPHQVTEALGQLSREHQETLASLSGGVSGVVDPLAQGRLVAALRTLLWSVAAQEGTLLVVEDVHWADPDTLDLVTLLGQGGGIPDLVTITTCRTDELNLSDHVSTWLANARRSPQATEIALRPLGRDAVGELVSWLTPGSPRDGLVDMVFRRSGGNPFFTEQVTRAYDEEGATLPAGVSALIGERLRRTSDQAQQVLAALAVAGRPLHPAQLVAITQLEDQAMAGALREVRASAFVSSTQEGVGLRHELLREALLVAGAGDSPLLHRRLAEQLEASGDDTLSGEAAVHYRAAGDTAAEARTALRAAERAWRLASYTEAAGWYERVIELGQMLAHAELDTPLQELRLRAVKALDLGGMRLRARDLAYRNRDELAADPDPLVRARSVAAAARFLHIDDPVLGVRELERAMAMFAALPASVHQAENLLFRATSHLVHDELEEALAMHQQALRLAQDVGDDQLATQVRIRLAGTHLAMGEVPAALSEIDHARPAVAQADDVQLRISLAVLESDLAIGLGRWAEATRVGRAALADAELHGMRRAWLPHVLTWNAAEAALEQGDLGAVGKLVDEMTDDPPRPDEAILVPMRAVADLARGSVEAAAARLDSIRSLDVPHGPEGARDLAWAATTVLGWDGRHDACVERGLGYLESVRSSRHGQYCTAVLVPMARSLASAAVTARARRDVARLGALEHTADRVVDLLDAMPISPFSDRVVLATVAGARAQWEAELGRLRGSHDLDLWRRAAEAWEGIGTPHRAAYCWWRYADAALEGERTDELRSVLQRAHELADGHLPQRQRITELAHRARVPLVLDDVASSRSTALPVALTAQEVNVLRLVAAGLTNTQIATELFISPKTVSVHVSNVLRKLEVDNRTQAGAWAVRVGLAGPRH